MCVTYTAVRTLLQLGLVRRPHCSNMYVALQLWWVVIAAYRHSCVDVYYMAFPKDKRISKTIVAVTYGLELLQTVLSTRDAFRNFGSGWGDMRDLDEVGWLWFSVPVLGSVGEFDRPRRITIHIVTRTSSVSCLAQSFYAWRVWVLSGRWYISAIIVTVRPVNRCAPAP